MAGSIIGYDLNEKYCQISFYNEEQQEPQTMETALDNYKIPLVIGKRDDAWACRKKNNHEESTNGLLR